MQIKQENQAVNKRRSGPVCIRYVYVYCPLTWSWRPFAQSKAAGTAALQSLPTGTLTLPAGTSALPGKNLLIRVEMGDKTCDCNEMLLLASIADTLQQGFQDFFGNLIENLQGRVTFWTLFGLTANLLFASRFVVQWYVSEKLKRSVIPVQFWYISIVGSLMMLVYSIYLGKVPLILGFLFPTVIYIRNLILLKKNQKADDDKGAGDVPTVKNSKYSESHQ